MSNDTILIDEARTLAFEVRWLGDEETSPTEDQVIVGLLRRVADVVEPTPYNDRVGEIAEATEADAFDRQTEIYDDTYQGEGPTPQARFDRQALADALRRLVADAVVAALPPLHYHWHREARDCDGRLSDGRDALPPEGFDGDEYDLQDLIWKWVDRGEGATIEVGSDDRGRWMVHSSRSHEEGYEGQTFVICTEDDYEPDYSGYRDHTAESMGY